MAELASYIHGAWPGAQLALFGSSANGFSFRHSDLDVSLTLAGPGGRREVQVVEELAGRLRKMPGVGRVVAITSAKVPIVKLYHTRHKVDADISVSNTLARENTKLLATYAAVDERARTLGYLVKLLAKVLDIGDASKGSLSSYAYILMVIYYLQQVAIMVVSITLNGNVFKTTALKNHVMNHTKMYIFKKGFLPL